MSNKEKPVLVITGSAGEMGLSLAQALQQQYTVVGFDLPGQPCDIEMDVTSDQSVELAWRKFEERYGTHIASVVHLAAYFDFTGEYSPLYDEVNVEGTRRLLDALQAFEVGQFIYSSTMLVHQPGVVGETIDEDSPLDPKWAYPQSKADTEAVIKQHHGHIPYLILRLAGLYDDESCVPTLAHQIARIYQRKLKSQLYAGDLQAGQSFIHADDLLALFRKAIEQRTNLPETLTLLAGEPKAVSYATLQDEIGELLHGASTWRTLSMPKSLSKAGAWLQEKSEPLVPDDLDQGEKPFIRPFMVDLASDHYALDITRVSELLKWQPEHSIKESLPKLIQSLKDDPLKWYARHDITPPYWMQAADEVERNPEQLRSDYEEHYARSHRDNLWAHLLNVSLGFWLLSSPFILGYQSPSLVWSDVLSGALVVILGLLSLSAGPKLRFARWGLGLVGLWLLLAPLLFWAPTAAAYLNDTLIGSLVIGFALLTRPWPGMSPTAAMSGPEIPPGWYFSPSSWSQRMPIIVLAFVGFFISRYLAAYQLGHIDAVWDPFFPGALADDAKNGTEEIITSHVSEAWPVPDAGIGALTYLLEILTGILGSAKRWRTMPWLVLLFGFMIVPLGAISITFIIIQPILLNTWCTLCLVAAAAMLIQIPYSFDEIVATLAFLRRRAKAGRPVLRILFTGDIDEQVLTKDEQQTKDEHQKAEQAKDVDNFTGSPIAILKDMLAGGVSLPWHLAGCLLIGLWLMFTRITLGNTGNMANADHLIGALILTVTVTATAEVMRSIRFLNIFLGMTLLITPFIFSASWLAIATSIFCALALIALSIPRGKIDNRYGNWNQSIL